MRGSKQLIIFIIIVVLCVVFVIGHPAKPEEHPTLIAIEHEWTIDTGGHAGKADEMEGGRKCWRVEQFDFHGQETWPAWRCVVLEGPAIGTIQWEWRNP